MMVLPASLVAHQGGWDEALIIVIPLVLYGAIRLWERYRGPEIGPEDDDPGPETDGGTDGSLRGGD